MCWSGRLWSLTFYDSAIHSLGNHSLNGFKAALSLFFCTTSFYNYTKFSFNSNNNSICQSICNILHHYHSITLVLNLSILHSIKVNRRLLPFFNSCNTSHNKQTPHNKRDGRTKVGLLQALNERSLCIRALLSQLNQLKSKTRQV